MEEKSVLLEARSEKEAIEKNEKEVDSSPVMHGKFANEIFDVLEPPNQIDWSVENSARVKENRAAVKELYEGLDKLLQLAAPIQETFEKYGVPLVITRSTAVYIWLLSLSYDHLIPFQTQSNQVFNSGGELLRDLDYLVPVEMWEEIDAALAELEKANKIRLIDKAVSGQEVHERGLKSFLFRQFVILDDNGKDVLEVDMFGGLGGFIQRDNEREMDYITFQAVTVDDNFNVVTLRNMGKDLIRSRNKDLRRAQIGESRVRYLVGEGLRASYNFEVVPILKKMSKLGAQAKDNALTQKEKMLVWKLRLIDFFLGKDPVYNQSD